METPPFATVADLEDRWRGLSTAEQSRATVLLGDASQLILSENPDAGELPADLLRMVTCNVVRRAMATPGGDDSGGAISQTSMTAGPYQQSFTFSNPSGDLYLTKAERRWLGITSQKAFEVDLLANRGTDDSG